MTDEWGAILTGNRKFVHIFGISGMYQTCILTPLQNTADHIMQYQSKKRGWESFCNQNLHTLYVTHINFYNQDNMSFIWNSNPQSKLVCQYQNQKFLVWLRQLQIIYRIITNAWKFTASSPVKISNLFQWTSRSLKSIATKWTVFQQP